MTLNWSLDEMRMTILSLSRVESRNFRLWDSDSGEKMDKDRFRQGLGGLKVAYEEVLNRILGGTE